MLDFLNDLKMSPNSSFCSAEIEKNVHEEEIQSPQPKPFPMLEQKFEIENFFSLEETK